MAILIGAARIDENGKIGYGSQGGDQTGHEVEAYTWNDIECGWNILAFKDDGYRALAVEYAWQIINNPYIGYGQHKHFTMLQEVRKVNYRFDEIATPCWTDCYQMIYAILEALGIQVATGGYTATQVKLFMATGAFDLLTGPMYAHTSDYLKAGWIGAMPPGIQGHTWIALETGPLAGAPTIAAYATTGNVFQRTGAGKRFEAIQTVPKNAAVNVLDFVEKVPGDPAISALWADCEYRGRRGFVAADYLSQALPQLYTVGNTWLRRGIGTNADTILAIPEDQSFVGTGETGTAKDGRTWYEAIYNGYRGWVSNKYLRVS